MGKKSKWTDEMLIADAARFETRGEWQRKSSYAYKTACNRNLLDVCCAGMRQVYTSWTDEMLIADAARFETRKEWQCVSNAAYCAARERNLLDVCCVHMRQVLTSWTEEMLIADAARFETRSEWQRGSGSAYATALRRNLLDVCCAHMSRASGMDNDAIYIWKAVGWTYNGEQVYKVGVTSARLGTQRINKVCQRVDVESEIVMLAKVNGKATALESTLLSIGHDPKYVDFDGCTEFRAMSDEQLKQALALIAQAAQETIDEESNVASEQE